MRRRRRLLMCTHRSWKLQREQIRFVKANDSPQQNPIFAKVIEDIASTERVLEQHKSKSANHAGFLEEWKEVLEEMPWWLEALSEGPSTPRKRTFLRLILGH